MKMKIRKFSESVDRELDKSRTDEINQEIQEFVSDIDERSKMIDKLINEFNNYKSDSTKGNDQIDDSIAALQVIKSNLSDTSDKLDTILLNLKSLNEEGRKYLYTENK
jgi:ABC-type transporter Mla subunit MlaD